MSGVATDVVTAPTPRATPDRKVLYLAAAGALLVGVLLLPLPAPLERAGTLIPLTAEGKGMPGDHGVRGDAVGDRDAAVRGDLAAGAAADSRRSASPTTARVVRAGFGDPIITFFIGVLMLSAAFTRSGLGTRLVYMICARRHADRSRAARVPHGRHVHLDGGLPTWPWPRCCCRSASGCCATPA